MSDRPKGKSRMVEQRMKKKQRRQPLEEYQVANAPLGIIPSPTAGISQYKQPSLRVDAGMYSSASATMSDSRAADARVAAAAVQARTLVDTDSSSESDSTSSDSSDDEQTMEQLLVGPGQNLSAGQTSVAGQTSAPGQTSVAGHTSVAGQTSVPEHISGTIADDAGDSNVNTITKKGRGYAKASSGDSKGKKKLFVVKGRLLGGKSMAGWFRGNMRNKLDDLYPQWKNVRPDIKKLLWEDFLDEYDLNGLDEAKTYEIFLTQNGEKYRKFLHDMKKEAIEKHKVKDVAELYNKPKPSFMKSKRVWKRYVRYWSSPEERARSEIATRNCAANAGSSHGFGRKGVVQRLHEMNEETGGKGTFLKVFIEVNEKKDKNRNKTGEYHNASMAKAIEEYRPMFREKFGPEVEPTNMELQQNLWVSTKTVASKMSKGRVLGVGTISEATQLLGQPERHAETQAAEVRAELEEMRRKHEDEMAESERRHQEEMAERDRRHQEHLAHQKMLEDRMALLERLCGAIQPNATLQPLVPPQQEPPNEDVIQHQSAPPYQNLPTPESPK